MSHNIAIIFLHGAGDTGLSLQSFFTNTPLELFNDRSYQDICSSLHIDILTPTSILRSYSPHLGDKDYVWYDRSRDWNVLGPDNEEEDINGIDLSINDVLTLSQ
jgi:hypothetical protein